MESSGKTGLPHGLHTLDELHFCCRFKAAPQICYLESRSLMSRDHSYPDQHLERPSFFFHPHPQSRLSKRGTDGSGLAMGGQRTT